MKDKYGDQVGKKLCGMLNHQLPAYHPNRPIVMYANLMPC